MAIHQIKVGSTTHNLQIGADNATWLGVDGNNLNFNGYTVYFSNDTISTDCATSIHLGVCAGDAQISMQSDSIYIYDYSDIEINAGSYLKLVSAGDTDFISNGNITTKYNGQVSFCDLSSFTNSSGSWIYFEAPYDPDEFTSSLKYELRQSLNKSGSPGVRIHVPAGNFEDTIWGDYSENRSLYTDSVISALPVVTLVSPYYCGSTGYSDIAATRILPACITLCSSERANAAYGKLLETDKVEDLCRYDNTLSIRADYDIMNDTSYNFIRSCGATMNLKCDSLTSTNYSSLQLAMGSATLQAYTSSGNSSFSLSSNTAQIRSDGTIYLAFKNYMNIGTSNGVGTILMNSPNIAVGRYGVITYGTGKYAGYSKYMFGVFNAYGYLNGSLSNYSNTYFMVGSGSSSSPKNGIRICQNKFFAAYAPITSGAGVAEYFEWLDGNPDNEDRIGKFVTLEGEKIRFATPEDDYILGAIDPKPFAVGDIGDRWQGTFLKDVFGRTLTEKVFIPKEVDEDGNVLWEDHYEEVEIINPEYDPSLTFVDRQDRQEYDAITSKGKIVLIDDGTCEVNGYATVGENGIATRSDTNIAVRVMKRVDDTHIYVYIDHVFSPRNC